MDMTLTITPEQMEALKTAYPDLSPDEAAEALFKAEIDRRYRLQIKRGVVVRLQGLKRARG